MQTYSTTQGTNLVMIASAISIIIRVFKEPGSISQEDILTLLTAGVIFVSAVGSYWNRFKKGDVTPLGAIKK